MMISMSKLPDDIMDLIGKKLTSLEDVVRFGAVCKSWQSVVESRKKAEKISLFPWLMLATYDHHKRGIQKFYSLSSKKTFKLKLPQIQGRRCFGTSFGWMVTFGIDLKIHLLNPFTGSQLCLPSQSTFRNPYHCKTPPKDLRAGFIYKFMAVQLQTPGSQSESESIIVFGIHSEFRNLSFARLGDSAWTLLDCPTAGFHDVISYNGEIYAFNAKGDLMVCEIMDTAHSKAIKIASPPEEFIRGNKYYLVEMNGSLNCVERVTSDSDKYGYTTDFFEVHEFDFGTKSWTYLYDLGEYALFLGTNTSYALEVGEFSELKRNCVYYTDDHTERYENKFHDMGVYDYGKQTKKDFYSEDCIWSYFSRPIFIRPCF